jgi:glycosyltransferase involved in cell wall biosynthesis
MRILFVSFISDSRATGMGKWTYRMQEELRQRGHETTAWFADQFPFLHQHGRLAVLAFPPLLAAMLHRVRNDFDVALIHEPSGFWHGLARSLGRHAVPMVAVCHNVEPHVFRQMIAAQVDGVSAVSRADRFKATVGHHWQSLGALRFADHVVCLSTLDRTYLTDDLGLPRERVTRVFNGVDPARFSPSRDGLADTRRVIFVGGWFDIKGARMLPAIWQRVRSRVADARLSIVGVGNAVDEVRRAFAPIGGVEVLPDVSDEEEMATLYRRHGTFLLPSLGEGSPLSALEAMASGLAVTVARAGGIPDIVEDEKSGLLFPVGDVVMAADAVLRVMTDRSLAQTLSRNAIERAQALNWAGAAEALERACVAAIDHRPLP